MIYNPILPGFYPDPSIVSVEETYYIVNSSFSYYPGIPIHRSQNLKEWDSIGYVLDRPSQLQVNYGMMSAGIFAPTIRYHEGVFYVVFTNMSLGCKNFIVSTPNPEGPWSEPIFIEGADGIDPSLFFDEDGRCYYTGTTRFEDENGGHQAIWCSEFDIKTGQLIGERAILWAGAMVNAHAPEGPHIYKREGYYYLMIAEGGTEIHHSVTISRSRHIMGPYEGCPNNPILTHRHLGKAYPISNVGHGDLVQTPEGDWYMVVLGSRLSDGSSRILGRETYLVTVEWEEGWPVVAPGTGRVENLLETKSSDEMYDSIYPVQLPTNDYWDDFDSEKLHGSWNMLGTPYETFWKLEDSKLKIAYNRVDIVPRDLDGVSTNPFERIQVTRDIKNALSFIGRRVQALEWQVHSRILLNMEGTRHGGMVLLQNDANQIRVDLSYDKVLEVYKIACISTKTYVEHGCQFYSDEINYVYEVKASSAPQTADITMKLYHTKLEVRIETHNVQDQSSEQELGETIYGHMSSPLDVRFLGSETAGGFLGTYIGYYAYDLQLMDEDEDSYLEVEWFDYRETVKA